MVRCGVLLLAFLWGCLAAWETSHPVSAALGGSSTALSLGSRSVFSNPAWLCRTTGFETSAAVAQLFQVPWLRCGQVSLQVPVRSVGLGAGVTYFSADTFYQEGRFASGASFGLGPVSAGLSVSLCYQYFPGGFGIHYEPGADGGALVKISDQVFLSSAVAFRKDVARLYRGGVCFVPDSSMRTVAEFEYQDGFPFLVRCGQEFTFFRSFAVRAGISSEPLTFSFGVGFLFHGAQADIGVSSHPDLGTTRSFGVSYGKARSHFE